MNAALHAVWMLAGWLALSLHARTRDALGSAEPACGAAVEDLARHYERVERELRAAPVDELPPELRERRARAIDWLREYRERAEFGRDARFPGERMPYFVDDEGRRCAVAWLLHRDGRDELVERVRASSNHAWVIELEQDAELHAWLAQTGLTLDEAARIQGPTGTWMPRGGSWGTPNGAGPAGPSRPRPAGPSTPGPAGPGTPSNAPATPGGTTPLGPSTGAVEAWWTWWQLHKLDYLRPNLLRNWTATVTGWAQESDASAAALDAVRGALQPKILAALEDGDPSLRGAAAIALGRTAGAAAVEPLRALLVDPSVDVREQALLALGATGSEEARDLLLAVARRGALGEARGAPIASDARAVAVLALAIGRRAGMDERVDDALTQLALELEPTDEPLLQASLLLYQTIHPTPALESWVVRRAADEDVHFGVRSRALETLRTQGGEAALAVLTRELSGRAIERRRSAALALGEHEHALALPTLLTAAELEREPLTRGFVWISIGRSGGEKARELLIEELREGRKDVRSWCALALGILARNDDDDSARSALREALADVKDRSSVGAYYLALGIARDARAEETLLAALRKGSTAEIRAAAAMALAMIGTEPARAALRERLESDPCPITRSEIAQALGSLGDARDGALLLEALADMDDPGLRGSMALALGLHGTRASVEGLMKLAADERASDAVRASCFGALQLVLGTSPSLTLGEVYRQSNFAVYPGLLVRLRDVLL